MLLGTPEVLEATPRVLRVRAPVRGGTVPSVVLQHFPDEWVSGLDDWAGREFLSRRGLELAPRMLAGDLDAHLLLLEDPGRGRTLETLLRGEDPRAATAGVLDTVRLVGQLHTRTLGAQSEYDLVRQALPPRHARVRIEQARALLEHEARLGRWLEAVGGALAPGVHGELETVARALADPGPFLAFTHGDLAPHRVLFTPAGPRLEDLGSAGMRHALWDALPWLVAVPLPDELVARADITYRILLSAACPAAQVDAEWVRARALVALARTVGLLQGLHPRLLEEEPEAEPGLCPRALLLHHLARCRVLLAPARGLAALTRTLEDLETRLRERWSVPSFLWPALRQAGF